LFPNSILLWCVRCICFSLDSTFMQKNIKLFGHKFCRNPTLKECEDDIHTLEMGTQSSIAGVKTPCLEVFCIPLKRSWSVNVENGLAWAIRTSIAQVMY
jgi:hypothetical protein